MTIEKAIVLGSDTALRNQLENYLRRCRCDVAAVSTISAAREYLESDNFDILFTDINLTDGNGINLLSEIQARPVKPLVVLTGGANSVTAAVEGVKQGGV